MIICKSSLSKFQTQIECVFETLKELPEHERNEAIALIQDLHTRSLNFVANKFHSLTTDGSSTSHQAGISDVTSSVENNASFKGPSAAQSPNLKKVYDDTNKHKQQLPVLFHMEDLASDDDQQAEHSEVSNDSRELMNKPVEGSEEVANDSLLSNGVNLHNLNNPVSDEMKSLLVSCNIVTLDDPITQLNGFADSENQKSSKIVSVKIQRSGFSSAKVSAPKKKVSKKAMVLRSAKKLKKKAMTKYIFQSDMNGQSGANRGYDISSLHDTMQISKVDEMSKYIVSCWFCKKSFKHTTDMNTHSCFVSIKERNDSGKRTYVYECLLCRITFLRLGHLRKHLDCHMRNVCKICDCRFARQNTLCRHMKAAHSDVKSQSYNCRVCKKTFTKKKSLHVHLRVHANGQLVCNECGEFFENETTHAQHIEIHFGEKSFFCKQCNEFFERKQQFEQHQMGHKRHVCPECNISFPTKKLWQKHQHGTHGLHLEEKKHKCVICQKTFLRPIHLRLHLQTHTGEKPTRCFQCGKNFSNSRTLAMHMKTSSHLKHVAGQKGKTITIDKPFLCALCGARFFRQQSLSRHTEQIHSCKTSLKCPHCEYSTKCDANLKRHIKLHTGKKQYVCEKCGASFHAMATLNDHHAYVHSEKRSFVCNLCTKSFKGRSGLQRHMRIHSEARPYKCHCNRSYKRMSHLKRHMSNAHQIVTKNTKPLAKSINSSTTTNPLTQITSSESMTISDNDLKSQTSVAGLSSLLNTGSSFTISQNEELHGENSTYDTLATATTDNYLVLPSGDVNMNFMSNNYQTLNIPATTSELISVSDVPSNILHLASQSSLHLPSVSQDTSVICSESTLDHIRSAVLDSEDFHCSKVNLGMTSSFTNFSISDGNNGFISTLLTNLDLHSPHLQGSECLVSEIEVCSSKPLFDDNASLLDMQPFSSSIHLVESKDLTTSVVISSDTDSLWNSSSGKEKSVNSVAKSSNALSPCPATIITTKHSSILQDTSDFFGGSLLFQNEHSEGCGMDPDALQSDELETLSSQVYNENVKQLLRIS